MSLHEDCVESLTTDEAFDLLGDSTRRRALTALRESDGGMSLTDLAEATVARAEDGTGDETTFDDGTSDDGAYGETSADETGISADRQKRTAASLHHCHLPKLDEAGIVAYDPAKNWVELTDGVMALEPYFEAIDELECA